MFISGGCNYLELLLKPMPQLLHLDLSGVGQHEGLGDFSFLRQLPALQSLVLHNVIGIDSATETLASIHTLRHLDLSHSDEKVGYYAEPNKTLDYLVTNLPQVRWTSTHLGWLCQLDTHFLRSSYPAHVFAVVGESLSI